MPDSDKVLVFGGSFDPPHIGHMNLLQNAVRAVQPRRVLVVPSGTSPHKQAAETPWPLRAAMCRCFCPLFPGLEVSDMEERRAGKSYTVDTLETLLLESPSDEIYLCIGGDMLESFMVWHRWRDILAMCTLVVTGRTKARAKALQTAAETLRKAGGNVLFADGPVVEVSSSQIRDAVAAHQPVTGLIPPPADAIVQENGLYV